MHKKLIIVFATDQGDCENLLHLLSFVHLHVLSAYYSMSRLAACVAICCDRLALKSQSSYTRGFFFIDTLSPTVACRGLPPEFPPSQGSQECNRGRATCCRHTLTVQNTHPEVTCIIPTPISFSHSK